MRARQGLHQGAVTRAVLAHQGQHFARVDVKVHAIQGEGGAEALAHPFHSQQFGWLSHGQQDNAFMG